MYSVSSASAQPTYVYVKPQRSLCSRITAFLLMLVCSYIMVSMIISVGVFMTASESSLQKFVQQVNQASAELVASSEAAAAAAVESTETAAVAVAAVESTETVDGEVQVDGISFQDIHGPIPVVQFNHHSTVRRAIMISLAVVLAMTIFVSAVYGAYLNSDAIQVAISNALLSAKTFFEQLWAEVSAGAVSVYQQVATFDYAGLWNDVVTFATSVFEEIKSYFVKEQEEQPIVLTFVDLENPLTVEQPVSVPVTEVAVAEPVSVSEIPADAPADVPVEVAEALIATATGIPMEIPVF